MRMRALLDAFHSLGSVENTIVNGTCFQILEAAWDAWAPCVFWWFLGAAHQA